MENKDNILVYAEADPEGDGEGLNELNEMSDPGPLVSFHMPDAPGVCGVN